MSPPSPPDDGSALAGILPDRFQISALVAEGGMGRIYKAHDRIDGRPALVKIVPGNRVSPERLAHWRRLNERLAKLGHPMFTPALDMGCTGDTFWLIMPFFAGQTLRERLESAGRVPYREAAKLVAELAEALELAHEQGLLHGNLTLTRILLGDDGQTRVLEFGELPLQLEDSRDAMFEVALPYAAPERLRDDVGILHVPSEVYTLGVILYEIMTGRRPFPGEGPNLIRQIEQDEPKPPRRLVRSIPAALEAICLKAMAKDQGARYSTAGELAAALRGFLAPAKRKGFWKSK